MQSEVVDHFLEVRGWRDDLGAFFRKVKVFEFFCEVYIKRPESFIERENLRFENRISHFVPPLDSLGDVLTENSIKRPRMVLIDQLQEPENGLLLGPARPLPFHPQFNRDRLEAKPVLPKGCRGYYVSDLACQSA